MADVNKFIFTVTTTGGTKKLTYPEADPEAPTNAVKAMVTAIVNNGDVFDPEITAVQGVILQTITEADYDLS